MVFCLCQIQMQVPAGWETVRQASAILTASLPHCLPGTDAFMTAACQNMTASPEEEELYLQPTNQVVQMCQGCKYPGHKHQY